jgi:hypothetical protein
VPGVLVAVSMAQIRRPSRPRRVGVFHMR